MPKSWVNWTIGNTKYFWSSLNGGLCLQNACAYTCAHTHVHTYKQGSIPAAMCRVQVYLRSKKHGSQGTALVSQQGRVDR